MKVHNVYIYLRISIHALYGWPGFLYTQYACTSILTDDHYQITQECIHNSPLYAVNELGYVEACKSYIC